MLRDFVSPWVKAVPPSGIRKFFDLATQMEGVISLGVGEPDFVTPWNIRQACINSLVKGYIPCTPEMREFRNCAGKLRLILIVALVLVIIPIKKYWYSEKLLLEEKVALVPGNVFGTCGEGYIRCSYAASNSNLTEALNRLRRFVARVFSP